MLVIRLIGVIKDRFPIKPYDLQSNHQTVSVSFISLLMGKHLNSVSECSVSASLCCSCSFTSCSGCCIQCLAQQNYETSLVECIPEIHSVPLSVQNAESTKADSKGFLYVFTLCASRQSWTITPWPLPQAVTGGVKYYQCAILCNYVSG